MTLESDPATHRPDARAARHRRSRVPILLSFLTLELSTYFLVSAGWRRAWDSDYDALATSINDDSYYYLLPAFNAARLGWFTFDGLNPTYGFQPLWELVLVGLALVCPDRPTMLRATMVTMTLLRASTAIVLFALGLRLRKGHTEGRALAALLASQAYLVNAAVHFAMLGGKENALHALVLATLLLASRGVDRTTSTARSLAVGVLLGLVPLARLSPASLATMLVVGAWAVRRSSHKVAILAGAAAPIAAWSAYAWLNFGHLMPTSGSVKLMGLTLRLQAGQLPPVGSVLASCASYAEACLRFAAGIDSRISRLELGPSPTRIALLGAAVVAAAGVLVARRAWRRVPKSLPLGTLVAGTGAATLLTPVLLHHRGDEIYYFNWYVTELPILAPLLLAATLRLRRRWSLVATIVLGIGLAVDASHCVRDLAPLEPLLPGSPSFQEMALRAAKAAQKRLDLGPDSRIGGHNVGLVGWMLDSHVINLDGLANEEIREVMARRLYMRDYVRAEGITALVDAMPPSGKWFRGPFDLVEPVDVVYSSVSERGFCVCRVTEAPAPAAMVRALGPGARGDFVPWSVPPVFQRVRTRVLSLEPPVEVELLLEREYTRVEAEVGVWSAGGGEVPPGRVGLTIEGDGRTLAPRRLVDHLAPPEPLRLDVRGVERMTIVVDDGGDGRDGDWLHVAGIAWTTTPPGAGTSISRF